MPGKTARGATALVVAILGLAASAVPASASVSLCNVPITMSDGVVLRANVFLPSQSGRFPTILTATGYNKDVNNPTGGNCAPGGGLVSADPGELDHGFAIMALDDRGTGASQGTWDSWGQRTQDDYKEVLDWIQAQPWSDSQVGMYGASYMGITSLLVSEADAARVAAGKPRAVKAVWADVPMADAYRDVTFHGGATDAGFIPLWLGLTTGLSDIPPSNLFSDPQGSANTYAGHVANTWQFAGQRLLDAATGGGGAYDGPFYRLRSPVERITSLTIPVAWTGGWWDIFQRGEPLLFEKMVNSPERKFFMTPNYHGSPDATAWAAQGLGPENQVSEKWFDHWIKGVNNGIQNLAPVNLYTMGANRWQHLPSWPVPNVQYTPLYLDGLKSGSASSLNDGSLEPAKPSTPGGDTTPLLPASSPCSRLTAQWTAGAAGNTPCQSDNRTFEASSLTYTTPPLNRDTEVTGSIVADLWAKLTGATDATLVGVLSDVDPSGASNQVSAGFLLASQRALDHGLSTFSPSGELIRPWHPFTQASQQPVTPGQPEQYQIEIYPTSNVFKAGHRIRLTLATADTPATGTPTSDLTNQAGGSLELMYGPTYSSHVLMPLIGTPSQAAAGLSSAGGLPAGRACVSRRSFLIRLRHPSGQRLVRATVLVNGRRVKVLRGARLRAPVDLTGLPRGTFKVQIWSVTNRGVRIHETRTYHTCVALRRHPLRGHLKVHRKHG
ncbi:MAG TPA: CocE/NonD family hydrolase [Solirubrobacteraceae bacterium]|jgi:hypothetical protein|nr:CocE/NonD family hydrolase [Solirubrobacteraceae bacterium]